MRLPRRGAITTRTLDVFEYAFDLAEDLGHDDVSPLHVAIGLIREGEGIAAAVLGSAASLDVLLREFETLLPAQGPPRVPERDLCWTRGLERVLAQAQAESKALDHDFQGTEHVLLALLKIESSPPSLVLARYGLSYDVAREHVLRVLAGERFS